MGCRKAVPLTGTVSTAERTDWNQQKNGAWSEARKTSSDPAAVLTLGQGHNVDSSIDEFRCCLR